MQEFKSHKSLESYETFCCGWVQDLAIYKPPNAQNTVVLAKVMHSRRLCEPPLISWVIFTPSGQVCSAHCTCMAGVAESCTHVGALLFMVDACVRLKEKATVTDEPAYWKLPSSINKVVPKQPKTHQHQHRMS
ncbi:hypothetical protein N1851_005170 [Merluccius polli]|uniref:SWIM-type domain-containing protein n=1 Tax=Merluccius polli TaxID=89951 RepID=A0AA47N7U6_MERPO|nr:hypothetical protein N1851_005170 [Merluccius polli]